MYMDMFGNVTEDGSGYNSYNLTEETLNRVAKEISDIIYYQGTLFCNIQIPSEMSQYDVLFSYNFCNMGRHQRGIKKDDLLIGIVDGSLSGFRIDMNGTINTSQDYYSEKLLVSSEMLTKLFNKVREVSKCFYYAS